jgi:GT2 family glycosyltransferase
MELSVIIVNWNSSEYLKKCLGSLYLNLSDVEFEVIVVDNASYDGCGEMLRSEFPTVRFIQVTKNLGFAGANNLGFAHSSGDNLLFLNPDTQVIGSAVNLMLSNLKSLPNAGAVGCRLLNSDGSVQIPCIQPFPTIVNQVLDTDHLIRRFPRLKIWRVMPLFHYKGKPEPVEVISGACLMVKSEVFRAVGMFSPDYFMYAEDVDLCYRIDRAGFHAYYVGEAAVIHHGGASTRRSKINHFNTVAKRESIALFFRKHGGKWKAFSYRFSMMGVSIVRLFILATLFPAGIALHRASSLAYAFAKWSKVLSWSLGFEESAPSFRTHKAPPLN